MLLSSDKKGQAVVEMALFGSLILLVFSLLISYLQRFNDQQYVQMEAFRRGLQKGNDYSPPTGGKGASVRFNLIENRRHSAISGDFRKGSGQTVSASTNVFWAVPSSGKQVESLVGYRINEDERIANYRDFVPQEKRDEWSFSTGDLISSSDVSFAQEVVKQENPQEINNQSISNLEETIITTVPYVVTEKDGDNDLGNNTIIAQGTFFEPVQGLYIDPQDGQYKYSQEAVGTVIERQKTWTTPF